MIRRIPLAAATALLLALALTACASGPDEIETTPGPEPAPSSAPTASEEPVVEEEPAADPTCESIVPESTVQAFTDVGWTYKQDDFRVGAEVVPGGMQCIWGDYTVASDHVQLFGWAPLDAAASAQAQESLLVEGWLRADDASGTYITENPDHAIVTDDEGYGMTYLFGDGWVTVADTKQSLILIDWR